MQYCVRVLREPRSQPLKDMYKTIVQGLREEDIVLKAVQKLLINTVDDRDYSAQETCHLLLQLPMYRASHDFVVLSLDGSCTVEERLQEGQPATVASVLNHYISRPATPEFETMTLLHFIQHYSMPKEVGAQHSHRRKSVVVIIRPYCPPNPDGPKYEQYCWQKLMVYRPFRQQQVLLAGFRTYTAAYADFLQSGNVPPSLQDDIHLLEQHSSQEAEEDNNDELHTQSPSRATEEWMLLCHITTPTLKSVPLLSQDTESFPATPIQHYS